MLTFNEFRNRAVNIWRCDELIKLDPPFNRADNEMLIRFDGGLYAGVADERYRAVISGVEFVRGSRTLIAKLLYALQYVHENGLAEIVEAAAQGIYAENAFDSLAAAFGAEEVDPEFLALSIKVQDLIWNGSSVDQHRQALCAWLLVELRTWGQLPSKGVAI